MNDNILLDAQIYPSDMTDEEWALVEPLLPRRPMRGNYPWTPKRDVINAIFMSIVADVLGECSRKSIRLGKPSTAILLDGNGLELGKSSMTPSVAKCD